MRSRDTRAISWIKAARKAFDGFPEGAQDEILRALTVAAEGRKADIAKPLKGFGSGVFEVALKYHTDAYRTAESKPRIASAKGRVKPLARLLRCASAHVRAREECPGSRRSCHRNIECPGRGMLPKRCFNFQQSVRDPQVRKRNSNPLWFRQTRRALWESILAPMAAIAGPSWAFRPSSPQTSRLSSAPLNFAECPIAHQGHQNIVIDGVEVAWMSASTTHHPRTRFCLISSTACKSYGWSSDCYS